MLRYLLVFGVARGGMFLAPLLVANSLATADYGRLEFAQAAGAMGASLLGLGTAAAVPLAVIQARQKVCWSALLLHQLLLCASVAVGLTGAWLLGLGWDPLSSLMVGFFTVSLAMQGLWSNYLKSNGRPESALVVDTGQWLVIALAMASALLLGWPSSERMPWVVSALLLYACGLLLWTGWRWRQARPGATLHTYRETLDQSVPLMTAGLLALVVISSGRLNLGLLAGPEMTGAYAALARVAALPIVAHQLVTVIRFRRVYEAPMDRLSRTLLEVLVAVVGCVVLFALAFHFLAGLFGAAFAKQFEAHSKAAMMILAQTVPWSAISLNDFVNTREGTAPKCNRWTATFLLLTIPSAAALLLQVGVTLERYVMLHSVILLGYFICQSYAMWRQGVSLLPAWSTAVMSFVLLSLLSHVA